MIKVLDILKKEVDRSMALLGEGLIVDNSGEGKTSLREGADFDVTRSSRRSDSRNGDVTSTNGDTLTIPDAVLIVPLQSQNMLYGLISELETSSCLQPSNVSLDEITLVIPVETGS